MLQKNKRIVRKNRSSDAVDKFEFEADEILKKWSQQKNADNNCPYDSAIGTFKRESYKLLRRAISDAGGHQVIKSMIRKWDIVPARLCYEGNQFHFGLLAIDPHNDVLNRRRLSLWSRQLAYAHLHEVPAHFLLGFLWQSGPSAEISEKLKNGYREPWLLR